MMNAPPRPTGVMPAGAGALFAFPRKRDAGSLHSPVCPFLFHPSGSVPSAASHSAAAHTALTSVTQLVPA
jgi:hypothetical protein